MAEEDIHDPRLHRYLTEIGEPDTDLGLIRDIGNDEWVMASRLLFHWTLKRGSFFDTIGYSDRWCYETEELAMEALHAFPVNPSPDYEPDGWHRHPATGRRRTDRTSATEYIEA